MKALLKLGLSIGILMLAISCAKTETADGGASGGQPAAPGVPTNCQTVDQYGNVPSGCPIPATDTLNVNGDLMTAGNAIVPFLKDMPGQLEQARSWNGGPVTFYNRPIRCGTRDGFTGFFSGQTCENDCKNFNGGVKIGIKITAGSGQMQFRAAYRAPNMCPGNSDNSSYLVQMPVWISKINGNRGFLIQSVPNQQLTGGSLYPTPGTSNWNKLFSIKVNEGVIGTGQSTYVGEVFYNNNFLGTVQLYRLN